MGDYDQHDNGRRIGQRGQKLRGQTDAERLRMQLADGHGTKEIATGENPPGPPGSEDDECERDPATAGRHVLHPLRRVDERQLRTGKTGTSAAKHNRQIARPDDG